VPTTYGRIPAAILVLIVAGAFLARLRLIDGSMPYPAHLDETELAADILRTGNWNPHQFEYPTLPVYLVTAGFAAGYLDACATRAVKRVADIGSVSFPYYAHRRVVRPARALFAFFSVVSIGLCGVIGYRLSQDPRVLLVAPLILCSSVSYLELSWRYLNVDIVGCFFVTALLAFLLVNWDATDPLRRSVIPGALCGLALASKYNLFSALSPGLLAIVLGQRRGRLSAIGLLLGASAATFLAAVPYAVLDLTAFLDGAGGAVHHYALGHPGFEAAPGIHQLGYYLHALVSDFGGVSAAAVLLGAVVAFRSDWKKASVLVSFAVTQLLYMSLQRAHFPRNVISVYPLYAVLEAMGFVSFASLSSAALSRFAMFAGRERASRAVVCLILAAVVLGTPWRRAVAEYLREPDSRKLATAWLRRSVAPETTVIVARELAMDTGSLRSRFHVIEVPFRGLDPATLDGATDALWLIPQMGYHSPRRRSIENGFNRSFGDARFAPLERFGRMPVLLDYPQRVPWGDPALTIARLRPTPSAGAVRR
jgi:4-amino-4-deoxy-L-arabinose transferase-like glycosyltransferase